MTDGAESRRDGIRSRVEKMAPAERAALEQRLLAKRRGTVARTTIPRREAGHDVPLSFAQQRMWLLEQMAPGNVAHVIADAVLIEGDLDVAVLRRSFEALVHRHESLRTAFKVVDGEPVQVIAEAGAFELPVQPLEGTMGSDAGERVRRLLDAEMRDPFDLERGPVFRVRLMRTDDGAHLLLILVHHIVSDAWSGEVMMRELAVLYDAFARGEASPLAAPPIQYADFAVWQRGWLQGDELERQMGYWRQQLGSVPTLELPTDRPRPALPDPHGGHASLVLPRRLTEALRGLCQSEEYTVYMVMLAALSLLLHRYSGQDDIVIGSPIANRNRSELEGVIGFFVNMLVLRTDLGGDPTGRALLDRAREAVLAANEHQDVPFEKLVDELHPARDLSRNPFFQVAYEYRRLETQTPEPVGLRMRPIGFALDVTRFDLEMHAWERGNDIGVQVIYRTDLFDAATIQRVLEHLAVLLDGLVSAPDECISQLDLMEPAERRRLLVDWNDTDRSFHDERCIHQWFEMHAQQAPAATALVFEDETLTYGELDRRANRLARELRARGVRPDSLVGICAERGFDMVVGILGILKAGGAYVPLDPGYPAERLAFMLADSGVSILLTQEHLQAGLPEHAAEVLCLDRDVPGDDAEGETALPCATDPENLAYVIYTSGSTGMPKGAMLRHRGLCNLSEEQARAFGVGPGSRVLQFSSLSFDASTFEIVMALAKGATLYLGRRETLLPGPDLLDFLRRHEISIVTLPPSALAALPVGPLPDLKTITVAGEACAGELVSRWAPGRKFFNLYGPTEATIWSTMAELQPASGAPHIGRPIGNTRIYVLDEQMRPVPAGVPGELCIAGVGLARGYHRRPALTADRFVPDPFGAAPGARLYRSGDLVRYLADGNVEFLGRIDHQVKLRGFRIELGEIEAALGRHPAVRETTVLCREDRPGEKELVAYVVSASDDAPVAGQLRRFLGETLPEYMVPVAYVTLDAMPVTRNGKIDRAALPAPSEDRSGGEAYLAPRSELEERISAIWCDVLGVEQVGVRDNFFELGGHSLRLVQVHARMVEDLGCTLSVTDLFQLPTIEALAERLRGASEPVTALRHDARARVERRGRVADEAIAVIGMSARFPGAPDVDTFWSNLRDGVESIRFYTDEELREAGVDEALLRHPDYIKAHPALDDVDLFDARYFGYNPREAELMDPQHRVFLECAVEALERAGYDPDRYEGLIAVYAGASVNDYRANVQSHPELAAAAAGLQGALGSHMDFLPTRVSYKLNLRGPSMNIQTACSTSLVAVHEACRALLDQQCDMALVGGVSISVPNVGGYVYQEGGIVSPDGHCRSFDARAQGTLRGDGAGIAVLKRLREALRDGDTVHAVILGSAVNNDGSKKVGYTAPSVDGQAQVIAMAQAAAGVEPETISYVEAHGTATPLGDPIEVAALTKVFREHSDKSGYCGLGSLKSNMGHLDAAAGVGGLIKTVLALEHKELPPSLHYERPNPEIDFEESPFYVNTVLRPWETNAHPRRAGVSSFGLGGTNAHVVLEEAPALAPSDPSHGLHLLVLSAQTKEALALARSELAAHLRSPAAGSLADVAFTLQVGRRQLKRRLAVRCGDVAEAVAALEGERPEAVCTGSAATASRAVAFMFPGQGAQTVNMGVELYREPGVFRDAMEACFEFLDGELGIGLREVLYPDGPLTEEEAEALHERLTRTAMAQPALLSVSYALAKQWMAWGIEPDSMIGLSIGEYVAACVSGVLSLEDALRLVIERGRLMEAMPAGVMTAVPLPAADVEALLDGADGLWLSLLNAPTMCVVSGTPERIAEFETRLLDEGTECRRLHALHGGHSGLMEGAVKPYVEIVRGVTLNAPQIPYVSNVTGDWIKAGEVKDPGYWGRHISHAVHFAGGMERVLGDPRRVVLEVGPGAALTGLAKLQESFTSENVAVSSLGRVGSGESATSALTGALGRLWASGVAVDWSRVHGDARRRRVTLPTYPFQRERYWIEKRRDGAATASGTGPVARRADLADWFYVPVWRRTRIEEPDAAAATSTSILVFANDAGFDRRVIEGVEQTGRPVVVVRPGKSFRGADCAYVIDPSSHEDYERLLGKVREAHGPPEDIVHLWSASFEAERPSEARANRIQALGLQSLLHLARALGSAELAKPLRMTVVTDGVHGVSGDEVIQPEKATVLGFCRTAPLEIPNLSCRNVDLALEPRTIAGPEPDERDVDRLVGELLSTASDPMVAIRRGHRWVQSFVRVRLDPVAAEAPRRLRPHGTYLITGGLGGMGLELAGELARTVQARLILTSRSPLPARSAWARHLERHGADDAISTRIRAIESMEAAGAEVMVAEVDACDRDRMQELVKDAQQRFGPIHGVLHLAGLPGGEIIQRTEPDLVERTLAPKLAGARVLEHLFGSAELDFMLLASSIITSWSVPGFVDYNAANAFLDTFARRFAADTGTFTVALDWPRWSEAGMAVEFARAHGVHTAIQGITNAEGAEVLRRTLDGCDEAQILVSEVDFREALVPRTAAKTDTAAATERETQASETGALHDRPELSSAFVAPRDDTERTLARIWRGLFGIERIGVDDNFFELGGDSVLGIHFVARAKHAGIALRPDSLFEHQTIAELAAMAGPAGGGTPVAAEMDQSPVIGEVPLTPIQHWFFEQELEDAHHFNLANLLSVRLGLSRSQWEAVVRELLEQHDALRVRFVCEGARWHQTCAPPVGSDEPVPFEYVDLTDRPDREQRAAIEARAAALQASINLAGGLVRLAVFDTGPQRPQRLLIVTHHLVMDAVSWPILLGDVVHLVGQQQRGEPLRLPPKTTSFQAWSRRLGEHARDATLAGQLPYWQSLPWQRVGDVPVDHPTGANTVGTAASVKISLDEEETESLVRRVPRAVGAQINEVLLAAVAQAFAPWTGGSTLLVDVEGHGREPLFEDVDLTRTVGWFTSLYPVLLDASSDPASTLATTQERLHAIPDRGMGYGLLRYLNEESSEPLRSPPKAPVVFLYLGRGQGEAGADDAALAPAAESSGPDVSPRNHRTHLLEIMAGVAGDRLHVEFKYASTMHERATIEALADRFLAALRALIAHCDSEKGKSRTGARSGAGTLAGALTGLASRTYDATRRGLARWRGTTETNESTSADFPLAELDADELRRVEDLLRDADRSG